MNLKEVIEDYEGFVKRSGSYIDNIDRKDMPVYSGVLKYFPNAIKYVAFVSKKGNEQHHPDKPLHWDMDKSTDEPDALLRHLIDHSINPIDKDGVLHLGKTVWRGLAMLERYLTNNNK
jgi:hypothetical protein